MRFTLFVLVSLLMPAAASARTVEIKISQCGKPLSDNINNAIKTLGRNDDLIINIDKPGKYELDGTIESTCNTTIKGISPSSTQLILKEGFRNGRTKFTDDTFIKVFGTEYHKVKVEIKNVAFTLADHRGVLWEDAAKHMVKIYHAGSVNVDNVEMRAWNAAITCLDLRNCSNVVVQNSTFENYNNCLLGGCLWSRGNQENIVVRNNKFWKYGNDESLAIWGGNGDRDMVMKNVTVEGNEFFYENKKKSKKAFDIDVIINFGHDEYVNRKCDIDNIVFKDNTITNSAPIKRSVTFFFAERAVLGSIDVENNTIHNTSKCSTANGYTTDFTITTSGSSRGNITLSNNFIDNKAQILCDGTNSGYTFLVVKNGNTTLTGNTIQSDYPIALVWTQGGNVNLNLFNNTASTLFGTALLKNPTAIEKVVINARNNEFTGNTQIYCNNLEQLELNFTNNTFNSTDYHFFILEGAKKTSVVFEENTINAYKGSGIMFANYSGKPYRFDRVQVSNNIFNGLTRKAIDDSFKSANRKTIQNNIYR